jgi:hypothetical protein
MSINIGTPAVEACRRLAGSEDFAAVREGLYEELRRRMNTALECAPELRIDATSYARALRDVYVAFDSATTGKPYNTVAKPTLMDKHNAR